MLFIYFVVCSLDDLSQLYDTHVIDKFLSTIPTPKRPSRSESPPARTMQQPPKTFKDLGVIEPLCEACDALGYRAPTRTQAQAISAALNGRDLLCLAEPNSGTTAAFVLPILQALTDNPQPLYSLILVPTSELILEVSQAVEDLGTMLPVRCALLIEGSDMAAQETALSQEPHIVAATPERILVHLENTKRFSLRNLKCLVVYGADRLVDLGFRPVLDRALGILPPRTTYLFAATISDEVESLQRAVLSNPVRVSVSTEQQTASTPAQSCILTPARDKEIYLVHLLTQRAGQTGILYTSTTRTAQTVAKVLQYLGFSAIPIHGHLPDSARLAALNQFRAGSWDLLVLTGASVQGLDIPSVDFVLNYDLPGDVQDYMRRVGWARAGGSGMVISFITQYEVEVWLRIEEALGERLDALEINTDEVMLFTERVRVAQMAVKEALNRPYST